MQEQPITIDHLADLMGELRAAARRLLRQEWDAASMRPTALVNSAILRNKPKHVDWAELTWKNRDAFFSAMHGAMRRALIDHARRRKAARRPTLTFVDAEAVDLYNLPGAADNNPDHIVALDEALYWLSQHRPDLVQIVHHHYFSGLTVPEIAVFVELSEKTVKRRLAEARVLLHKAISEFLHSENDSEECERL